MLLSHSETTTTTPTPISPFSCHSGGSDATSDDLPDLGAFTQVFREFNHIQASLPVAIPISHARSYTSSLFATSSSFNSRSTGSPATWPQGSHSSCISDPSHSSAKSDPHGSPPWDEDYGSGSHTEGEGGSRAIDADDLSDLENMDDPPSLGYLDQALSFIAAERTRIAAQRDCERNSSSAAESAWRHVVRPHRTRRRRKSRVAQQRQRVTGDGETTNTQLDADNSGAQDADESSSDHRPALGASRFKSTPATPSRRKMERHRQRAAAASAVNRNHRLHHSKSTPTLRLPITLPLDPRILRLRALAHKLRLLFPANSVALSAVLSNDLPDSTDFVDPRGPRPHSQDTLVHVFVDHSNILIGLLNFLKRKMSYMRGTIRHMSHAALALILERGRPITRRVVVASSPLYQPMDSAEQLGYEVRIYARVPDTGDSQDRRSGADTSRQRKLSSSLPKGHSRKKSGNASTESEAGAIPETSSRGHTRSLASNSIHTAQKAPPNSPSTSKGIRYREQGVDELLQLKLHQAIADDDPPPPNATIVLATGDGNVGQFHDDGFLGPVRAALKKGWKVELYAWEDGLSKAWKKEFGEGSFKERFIIIGLEQFAFDMVQILDIPE